MIHAPLHYFVLMLTTCNLECCGIRCSGCIRRPQRDCFFSSACYLLDNDRRQDQQNVLISIEKVLSYSIYSYFLFESLSQTIAYSFIQTLQ